MTKCKLHCIQVNRNRDEDDDGDDGDDGEFRILFVRWNSIGPGWVSKSDLIGESASVFEVAFHSSVFIHN